MERAHRVLPGSKAGPGPELQHEKVHHSEGQRTRPAFGIAKRSGRVGEGGQEVGSDVRASSLLEGGYAPACSWPELGQH